MADDDEFLREMYSLILRRNGFTVTNAKDGSETVSRFIEERPELVILDNNMPRYTGLQVALEILAFRPSTRIIMLTSDHEALREAEMIGIDMFLVKPISTKKLVESVVALAELHPTCEIIAR